MSAHKTTWLDRLPVVVTVAVALAAGILAAENTAQMAVRTGAAAPGWRSFLVPVALEGGALTMALLGGRRHRTGLRARYEATVLVALLGLATAVNASHAAGAWPGEGVVLSGAAPVILALSVHGLVRARDVSVVLANQAAVEQAERERQAGVERERAERSQKRRAERATSQTTVVPERPTSPDRVQADRTESAAIADQASPSGRAEAAVSEICTWLSERGTVELAEIQEHFKVAYATARRYRKAAMERQVEGAA